MTLRHVAIWHHSCLTVWPNGTAARTNSRWGELNMTARTVRITSIFNKVDETAQEIGESVADARASAEHCPCVPHDQQAAEATDRALERSVVLVEQLRTLRFALLNGWNGPVGIK